MWYQQEFPDFVENLDYVYKDLNVPMSYDYRAEGPAFQKWIDCSWHNNSCPSFDYIVGSPYDEDEDLSLFVDYGNPDQSQNAESRLDGSMKRYTLYREQGCQLVFETDYWFQMVMFIRGYTDALKQACVSLAEQDLLKPCAVYRPLNKIFPVYYKVGSRQVEDDIVNNFFS